MNKKLKEKIEKNFYFRLNQNQYQDLERLIFEIKRRQNISTARLVDYLKINSGYNKQTGKNKFIALKNCLIKYRYPLTSAYENINKKKIFLNKIRPILKNNWMVKKTFKPAALFFEKETKGSYLVKNFRKQFPNLKIEQISTFKNYVKNNQFKLAKLKKPLIFITKETRDFLKPCPCTKNHLGCGYWIFNLGYGCPFDCSYCYLQQYTNSPGIVLPANLDDFFTQFAQFEKKLTGPVRIGTGEFLDSLALDHITNYSSRLISYFRNKKVLFELKTKSDKIDNILREKPASNIIISWSLNPKIIVNSEEKGTPGLQERLVAAKKVQNAGFKVAFHFDPIIYYKNWEKDYKELTRLIYEKLSPPFAWISLGTLRANRQLKPIVEQRFPESDIFYGELFIGEDKKLRYPQFLRKTIYTKMFKWIRYFDSKTPLYLCMENKDLWKAVSTLKTTKNIENYLIKNNLKLADKNKTF
jgi:spore photoproduct lyase